MPCARLVYRRTCFGGGRETSCGTTTAAAPCDSGAGKTNAQVEIEIVGDLEAALATLLSAGLGVQRPPNDWVQPEGIADRDRPAERADPSSRCCAKRRRIEQDLVYANTK